MPHSTRRTPYARARTSSCSRDSKPLEQFSRQPKLGAVSESLIDSLVRIGDITEFTARKVAVRAAP